MAGKPKKKLDYAGWNTDIFENEPKIDKLLAAQGWVGFGIYFYLCQRAYGSEGYYYRWSYDDVATTARKMGCGIRSETVRQTVALCFQIGLFDKRLFEEFKVLTSRGIQKKYWLVASERTDRSVIDELWLLNDDECRGCLKVTLKSDSQPENDHSTPSTSNVQPLKKSKVKDSKYTTTTADAKSLIEFVEETFGRPINSTEMEKIIEMQKAYTEDLIILALKETALNNVQNINYTVAILANWKAKGYDTVEKAQAGLEQRRIRVNGKGRSKRPDVLPDYYVQMKSGSEKETAEETDFDREEFEEIRRKLKEQEK